MGPCLPPADPVSARRLLPARWGIATATLLAGAMVGVACAPDPPEASPPIVLVIADTLRADVLGSYGGRVDASPELDALARGGVRFERVIAPSSWTRPSTGALLTGRLPRRLGLYRERDERLPASAVTLAEALRARGYRTWGAVANPSLNRLFGFDQGFERWRDSKAVFTSFMEQGEEQRSYAKDGLTPSHELLGAALRALPKRTDEPWLVLLNLMEAHEYARGDRTLTRPELRALFPGEPSPRREYLQAVRQLSRDVADFIAKLRRRPGWERTLLVVTSDHGEGLDSHPRVPGGHLHGTLLYESQVRVPLVLNGAGLEPRVVSRPVRLLDLAPTLLELAGARQPEGLDGRSLLPLLRGEPEAVSLPRFFVTETYFREPLDKQAVYGAEWSYFEHDDGLPGTAPRELHPAGHVPARGSESVLAAHPDAAERMHHYLSAWNDAHPRVPPTAPSRPLSDEERRQLEAIGYLQ